MSNKLLPASVADSLSPNHQATRKIQSNSIYVIVIAVLIISLLSLPFAFVSVNIKSSAIIRPATEINTIRSLINGRVKESFITENQQVKKGQILYVIESDLLQV